MKGGLVELPTGTPEHGNYRDVLRAADHGKPLITADSGFSSPIVQRIEEDERKNPIPDDFLDFLEGIPTSYVLVHDAWLDPALRATHRPWIDRGLASGRLVFVKRFDGEARNDLFAVAKNEPAARSLEALPWTPPPGLTPSGSPWREDASLTGSVDEPAEGATVRGPLRVTGWARIPGEDLEVTLLIDGERRPPSGAARVPRRDVEAAVRTLGDCATAGLRGGRSRSGPPTPAPTRSSSSSGRRDGRERHYRRGKFRLEAVTLSGRRASATRRASFSRCGELPHERRRLLLDEPHGAVLGARRAAVASEHHRPVLLDRVVDPGALELGARPPPAPTARPPRAGRAAFGCPRPRGGPSGPP